MNATAPTDADIDEHFLTKCYFHGPPELAQNGIVHCQLSNDLVEYFFELLDKSLFAKLQNDLNSANAHFAEAKKLADTVNDAYLISEYEQAYQLKKETLKKKLQIQLCYEYVNRTLERDKNQGHELISAGLALAEEIKDKKRILDFLCKCHYVLYELENYPRVALNLGDFIISEASPYEPHTLWSYFHNGNIFLDFKQFDAAKTAFEQALEIALKTNFHYAVMTLFERLALTYFKLGHPNIALNFYHESLNHSKNLKIRHHLNMKNEVRCLIGIGNIHAEAAKNQKGAEKNTVCAIAEDHYKTALDIANQINYAANKAAALSSLGDLYRIKNGESDPNAKKLHNLAVKIHCDELKLDNTLERVQWDQQHS
ncbi:MAG: hypothetical protein ACE5HS_11160 [bacterium]